MSDQELFKRYQSIDELIEDFGYLDDWEDRYAYLIDLGKGLTGLPEHLKSEEHKVRGCTSQVWLVHEARQEADGIVHYFAADSDAFIVRGLVSIVLSAYSGKSTEEIQAINLNSIFTEIGLERNLSVSRRNGFASMIERVQGFVKHSDSKC